ncbi:hypothetical protein AAF712_016760, partial [Marasmius tenuissimus]
MFRIHLHQHPEIPFDDEEKPRRTAEQIYQGAVEEMYQFCFEHDLSQVWAYLWNRWYSPKQWVLWARSADEAIPRLKTTMIVESLWRVIKHDELGQFHRPRLDLVMHIIVHQVLPRVEHTLDVIFNRFRPGRPKPWPEWKKEAKAGWVSMSRTDEHRLVETELRWRKAPKNTKGRTEHLEMVEAEKERPRGCYETDVNTWTCSCSAYLISRFLMCKHLVRDVNKTLDNLPLRDTEFWDTLQRNWYPPFYSIAGIHHEEKAETRSDSYDICVLGRDTVRSSSPVTDTEDLDCIGDSANIDESEGEIQE